MRIFATIWTKTLFKFSMLICSVYIILLFPLSILFLLSSNFFYKKSKTQKYAKEGFLVKDKVLEMIKSSEISTILSAYDQKIITAFITFREKVAREIMVPRVNVFSLPRETTIKEAGRIVLLYTLS